MDEVVKLPEHDGYCVNCGKESPYIYCNQKCEEEAEQFERARQRDGSR
jgi:hypothetical protein